MGNVEVSANIEEAQIEAIITRADGTVENLGTIAKYNAPSLLERITSQENVDGNSSDK